MTATDVDEVVAATEVEPPGPPAWLGGRAAGPVDPDLDPTPRPDELPPDGARYLEAYALLAKAAAGDPRSPWTSATEEWRQAKATDLTVGARLAEAQSRRAGARSLEDYLARTEDPPEIAGQAAKPRPSIETLGVVNARSLMERHFQEPRWAIPGIVPEGLVLFASKPKLGKSWLALGVAVACASGGRALGILPVDRGPVLVLALEDTLRRLQSRLVTILDDGAEPPEDLDVVVEWRRLDDGGLADLRGWLERHPRARLVIVDTLARIRPGRRPRESRLYDDDYNELVGLKALADEFRVAIVVVHHLRKAKADDPIDQLNASSGMAGAADAILILERGRGEHDAKLHVQGRDVEEATHALRWSPGAGTWAIVDPVLADVTAERAEIIEYLAEADGPKTPSIVAAVLGRPAGSVKRLMWSMARDGQLRGGGRGGYSLPEGDPGSLGSRGSDGSLGDPGSLGSPLRAGAREESPRTERTVESVGSLGSRDFPPPAGARDPADDVFAAVDADDEPGDVWAIFGEPAVASA